MRVVSGSLSRLFRSAVPLRTIYQAKYLYSILLRMGKMVWRTTAVPRQHVPPTYGMINEVAS